MICPNCGSSAYRVAADGSFRCTACDTDLNLTQRIQLDQTTWCPACGALMSVRDEVCPKCGAVQTEPHADLRPKRNLDLPDIGHTTTFEAQSDSDRTGILTRIQSAIPTVHAAAASEKHEGMQVVKAYIFAITFAVAAVSIIALLLTHPWDPEATMTRTKTPADISRSGFPGEKTELKGQDVRNTTEQATAEKDTVFQTYEDAYRELKELNGSLEAIAKRVGAVQAQASADERSKLFEEHKALALKISNLIQSLQNADNGAGTYTETKKSLIQLGNWVRNRSDKLNVALEYLLNTQQSSGADNKVEGLLQAQAQFDRLFKEKYAVVAPQKPASNS